ncbi:MAG: putative toxin-antitoxin system toxin component, PIN family [Segetibacter sp.]
MKKKFVIDTSVYITYAAYDKIYRLADAINQYDPLAFINDELLIELENNIADSLMVKNVDPLIILIAGKEVTIHTTTQSLFTGSPDPKDNFLLDLALHTNSEVIVTQKKALLSYKDSPKKKSKYKMVSRKFSCAALVNPSNIS